MGSLTSDDAALRIANDLTSLGVHGTFKVVGEKARVLEQRGRMDVIQALGRHCIGYHSDWHSVQPVPAVALQHLGLLEGAAEFERRQRAGFGPAIRLQPWPHQIRADIDRRQPESEAFRRFDSVAKHFAESGATDSLRHALR